MLNSHWHSWEQAVTGLLLLLVQGTLYWYAWAQPACRSFAKFSPAAKKTLLAVSAAGMMVLILVWVWASGQRG
ncbi:MAG: hypothetical protein ABSB87_01210 [Terriglobales bacterium]|jgi:hypothetical protein